MDMLTCADRSAIVLLTESITAASRALATAEDGDHPSRRGEDDERHHARDQASPGPTGRSRLGPADECVGVAQAERRGRAGPLDGGRRDRHGPGVRGAEGRRWRWRPIGGPQWRWRRGRRRRRRPDRRCGGGHRVDRRLDQGLDRRWGQGLGRRRLDQGLDLSAGPGSRPTGGEARLAAGSPATSSAAGGRRRLRPNRRGPIWSVGRRRNSGLRALRTGRAPSPRRCPSQVSVRAITER